MPLATGASWMYEPTSWRPHMPGGVHERAGRQQCAVAGRRRVLPHHVSGARLGPGLRQLTRAAPCACRRAQRRLHAPRQNRERKSDRSLPARPASAHPPRAARQPGGGPRRVRRARGREPGAAPRRCAAPRSRRRASRRRRSRSRRTRRWCWPRTMARPASAAAGTASAARTSWRRRRAPRAPDARWFNRACTTASSAAPHLPRIGAEQGACTPICLAPCWHARSQHSGSAQGCGGVARACIASHACCRARAGAAPGTPARARQVDGAAGSHKGVWLPARATTAMRT